MLDVQNFLHLTNTNENSSGSSELLSTFFSPVPIPSHSHKKVWSPRLCIKLKLQLIPGKLCQGITSLLHLLIPFIWRGRGMCLAPVNLLVTAQQRASSTLVEPVQLSYSQSTFLTHQWWQRALHLLQWSQAKQELAKVARMMFTAQFAAASVCECLFCVNTVKKWVKKFLSLDTIVSHPSKHKNVLGWSKLQARN